MVWTCVQVHSLKESRYFRWVNCAQKKGYSYERHPGQPLYLIKNGRQNRQPHSLGSPRRASNRTSDPSSGRPEGDTLWATTRYEWKQNYQNGFNYSRKDGQRGSSSSADASPPDVVIPPPALPPSTHPPAKHFLKNKAGGKHNSFTHFPNDPELRSVQTHVGNGGRHAK